MQSLVRELGPATLAIQCPGCKHEHRVRVANSGVDHGQFYAWQYNGKPEAPTFWPSLNMTSGHYCPNYDSPKCWCTYRAENPNKDVGASCVRCHSFVVDGQIQFLADSTHELAGKTVPLIPYT